MFASHADGAAQGGCLCLVVGASGVGKDMLLAHARAARDPAVAVLARMVTRPADAGGEAHVALDRDVFARERAQGRFLLSWQAHGLAYGLPAAPARAALAEGRLVLANVSRRAIGAAESLGIPLAVIHVRASPHIVAARLAARGRESAAEIAARLARTVALDCRAPVHEIWNDGTPEQAAACFDTLLAMLKAHA